MTTPIELSTKTARVILDPDAGAVITRYDVIDGDALIPVLHPARLGFESDPTRSSMFIMLPWCNRLSAGGVWHDGEILPIKPNWPSSPYPIHGIGWLSGWETAKRTDQTAILRLKIAASPNNPYEFAASLEFILTDNALSISAKVTNTGKRSLPFGIGFHPYFPRSDQAFLRLPAREFSPIDENGLPMKAAAAPQGLNFEQSAKLDLESYNGVFETDQGFEYLQREKRILTRVSQKNTHFTQLWAPKGSDFICIEPLSHMVDAFCNADGFGHSLAHGQSKVAGITLSPVVPHGP